MNRYLSGLAIGTLVATLTACGGSSSSDKPKSSSSVSSSTASLPASSVTPVSSAAPATSSSMGSSMAPASSAAQSSNGGAPISSSGGTPASSSALVSSTPNSSAPASSVAALSSVPASSALASSSTPASSAAASAGLSSSAAVSSSSSSIVALAGVFIDSAVAGVSYQTSPGGFTGVTSATGQYFYAEGDTVTFSIGAIEFPPVEAKGIVTPVDMAPSGDVNDTVVVNIAVLLQSLDSDGDPSNGISIPSEAVNAAVADVNFNQPYTNFAADILPVVQHTDNSKNVVGEATAVAHLEESIEQATFGSLKGTWYLETEDYKYMLFVLDGARYAALDFDSTIEEGAALEMGNYSWNQTTGEVTLSSVSRTDSLLDATPPLASGNKMTLNGNTLTLVDGDETFILERLVASDANPLVGGWSFTEGDALIVFGFNGSHYFMGQSAGEGESGHPGAEMGSYAFNGETKEIQVATLVDTNGQWGLSHPCAVLNTNGAHPEYEQLNYLSCGPNGGKIIQTIDVTGDTLTFISEADTIANNGEEDEFELQRVNGLPDGDIHLQLEVTLTLTAYSQGVKYQVEGATMQCDLDSPRQVGETEVLSESWVLGSNPNRETWVSTIPASYNPDTKKLSFDIHEAVKPVPGHPGFYEEFWEVLDATYNAQENHVITGTYSEKYNLTWNRGSQVSTCEATYQVVGVVR